MLRFTLLRFATSSAFLLAIACGSDDGNKSEQRGSGGSAQAGSAGAAARGGSASGGSPGSGGGAGTSHTGSDIRWASCTPPMPASAECGSLEVPINYSDPAAGTLNLAVARVKATASDRRLGVLLLNPGGPGASGVEMLAGLAGVPSSALSRFDLVSFDPRGIAESGQISCEYELFSHIDPKQGIDIKGTDLRARAEAYETDFRAYLDACKNKHGDMLLHVGTQNVVRDMDRLREALGEEQVSYLGFSYGTWLGAAYAIMFPERVRAMALDAVMPPEADLRVLNREGALAKEFVLERLDSLCKASASCALQPSGVISIVDGIAESLRQNPLDVGHPSASFTAFLFLKVVSFSLSNPNDWGGFVGFLVELSNGLNSGTISNELRSMLRETLTVRQDDAFNAVICADVASTRTPAEVLDDAAELVAEAPHFWPILLEELPCTVWDKPKDPIAMAGTSARDKLLLVGTDGDPSTPYAWSERLSKALGGTAHVHNTGNGHTSYFFNACTTEAIDGFLLEVKTGTSACGNQLRKLPLEAPGASAGADKEAISALLSAFIKSQRRAF